MSQLVPENISFIPGVNQVQSNQKVFVEPHIETNHDLDTDYRTKTGAGPRQRYKP